MSDEPLRCPICARPHDDAGFRTCATCRARQAETRRRNAAREREQDVGRWADVRLVHRGFPRIVRCSRCGRAFQSSSAENRLCGNCRILQHEAALGVNGRLLETSGRTTDEP
jgi:hypothetical protein